jgi:hypothetical protein
MKSFIFCIVVFFTLAVSISFSQDFEYVESAVYSGAVLSVTASGNYAYALTTGRLLTISMDNPFNPVVVNSIALRGQGSSLLLSGGYLYYGGSNIFQIYDISVPSEPELMGSLQFQNNGSVSAIAIVGNHAFLASGSMKIIDITNPSNPVEISQIPWTGYSIGVSGNNVYLGTNNVLFSIDITNINNPQIVWASEYWQYNELTDIRIADTLAFVASRTRGMLIYSIADPTWPYLINTYMPGVYGISKLILADSVVYMSNHGTFNIVNISNIMAPNILWTYVLQDGSQIKNILLSNNRIFMGADTGLRIIDVSNSLNPSLLGQFETYPPLLSYVKLNGNYAYLPAHSLFVVNISDTENPVLVNNMQLTSNIGKIFIDGNYAYSFASNVLLILDLHQPDNPQLISNLSVSEPIYDIYEKDSYLYVAASAYQQNSGMYVVNVSNPSSPNIVSHYNAQAWEYAMRVIVRDTIAYFLVMPRLISINVADPSNPVEISSWRRYENSSFVNLAIEGNYAYVMESIWMDIVDISNPASPSMVNHYVCGNTSDILVRGNYAYIPFNQQGIQIVNISDPLNPFLQTFIEKTGSPYCVDVRDDLIYLADTYSMGIYRYHPTSIEEDNNLIPFTFSLSQNYPNPFNPVTTIQYALPKGSIVTLDIYDILGRKIETLVNGKQEAGAHSVIWDGWESASGIYFYRLQAGDYNENRKMLLLK